MMVYIKLYLTHRMYNIISNILNYLQIFWLFKHTPIFSKILKQSIPYDSMKEQG